MKINVDDLTIYTSFGALENGETFYYEPSDVIWMKLREDEYPNSAVSLDDGTVCMFNDDERVIKVDIECEVTVNLSNKNLDIILSNENKGEKIMNISLNGDFTIDELRKILSLAENKDEDICVNKSPNEFLICDLDNECIYGTVRTDKSKEEVQKIINDVKKIESYDSWDLEERFDEEGISYTNSCEKVYF
jgi:hypothetical protein